MKISSRKKPEQEPEEVKRNKQGNWPFPAKPPTDPAVDPAVDAKVKELMDIINNGPKDEQTDDSSGIGDLRWNHHLCWFEVFNGQTWEVAQGDPYMLLSQLYLQSGHVL